MASADQIRVYNILAVENHVVPLDGADVLQELSINVVLFQIHPGNLVGLPVDDAGQN